MLQWPPHSWSCCSLSGSQVSPGARSPPRTQGRPPASALELEQLLHLVLRPPSAPETVAARRRLVTRTAVRQEDLDVEFIADTPRHGILEICFALVLTVWNHFQYSSLAVRAHPGPGQQAAHPTATGRDEELLDRAVRAASVRRPGSVKS